jgi:hypothetical protein
MDEFLFVEYPQPSPAGALRGEPALGQGIGERDRGA